MNINDIPSFHTIFKMKWSSYKNIEKKINKQIPSEWQFIVMNKGSLTQNLNSLLMNNIQLEMCQKYTTTLNQKIHNIRIVWLNSNINQPLTFAKSIWIINSQEKIYHNILLQNNPIGYSLINYQVDIYKELQEVYCGYCYNLEKNYENSNLIWGRKYKIFYPDHTFVIIDEYFTPSLVTLFN